MTTRSPTSPYAPDLAQLRAWPEQMLKAMKFVELVLAILAFSEPKPARAWAVQIAASARSMVETAWPSSAS
jgi:hypothetical protein